MKELQAIKLAAEEEVERQRASYFQRLRSLEETVVRACLCVYDKRRERRDGLV